MLPDPDWKAEDQPGVRARTSGRGSDFPLHIFADSALEKAQFYFIPVMYHNSVFCCKNSFPLREPVYFLCI